MKSNNIINKNIIYDNKDFIFNIKKYNINNIDNNYKIYINKSTRLNILNPNHNYYKKLIDTSKISFFLRRNNFNLNFNDKNSNTNINNNNNINYIFKRNSKTNLYNSKSKISILNLNKNSLNENELRELFFPKKENNIKYIFSKSNKKSHKNISKTSRNKIINFFNGKIFEKNNNYLKTSSYKRLNVYNQNFKYFFDSCNLNYKKLINKKKITNDINNLKYSISTKYLNNNIPDLFRNKEKNQIKLYGINKFFITKKPKIFKLK